MQYTLIIALIIGFGSQVSTDPNSLDTTAGISSVANEYYTEEGSCSELSEFLDPAAKRSDLCCKLNWWWCCEKPRTSVPD